MNVLYHDNHLLVINKPAPLATMGAEQGTATALSLAKAWLKQKYNKPGNVYLGVVSRLDAMATGALVFARTSKAASRLTDQYKAATVQKTYWALVEGVLSFEASDEWIDYLIKDDAAQRMRTVTPSHACVQRASLAWRRLDTRGGAALVEIELRTGRKHQIRVQFADRGHPILGDKKYGSTRPFPRGIALHSRRLAFQHPTRDERVIVEAPLPAYWPAP